MVPLDTVAVLPATGDNCAVALRLLPAGTAVTHGAGSWSLFHDVPEGHRFTVRPVEKGAFLTSWGLPFGVALVDLPAGCYLCNELIREELGYRTDLAHLPSSANFRDWQEPVDPRLVRFVPGDPPALDPGQDTFEGYRRPGGRGTGTRNFVVLLGVSSRVSSFVRVLAQRLQEQFGPTGGFDGIVAAAHTEGGGESGLENRTLLLRTLAGWARHPNVGAVLLVEAGGEPVGLRELERFLDGSRRGQSGGEPGEVLTAILTTRGEFERPLAAAAATVAPWVERLRHSHRTSCPVSELRIALQCGGSDSFSGLSANPLAGAVAARVIRQGGAANLAETPELAGAEPYLLSNVRDLQTASQFLGSVAAFRDWMAQHGHSPEANPSAGNRRRGLYNITLKSLGAAMKKAPEVRLEEVVDYAEPPSRPGLYFMNSPGNDLESIAGQVASGCNLILFTTGSGSVTNFPFVPTIKIMSTSARFQLLVRDMDVNAGRVLDGEPLARVAEEAYQLARSVASGQRSCGERAGHSQVSVWRDWTHGDPSPGRAFQDGADPSLNQRASTTSEIRPTRARLTQATVRPDLPAPAASLKCHLILPTSLCAGQVAVEAARRLEVESGAGEARSRVVALPHTEGCGSTGGASQDLFEQVLVGHLTHPLVRRAMILEHGCEKVHNLRIKRLLTQRDIPAGRFGWAGIQADGGFEKVLEKIREWFSVTPPEPAASQRVMQTAAPTIGIATTGPLPPRIRRVLNRVGCELAAAGWAVLTPDHPNLNQENPPPAGDISQVGFGTAPPGAGRFRMETVSRHWVETLAGLGTAGCLAVIAIHADRPRQGHPLVPVIRVGCGDCRALDLDLILQGPAGGWADTILESLASVLSGRSTVRTWQLGDVDFQVPRGPVGISV